MARPRTWLFVAGGCLVAGVLAIVAFVGAGAWFFARHVDVRDAPTASAEAEFDEVKRRFEGQAPLIDPTAQGRDKVAELERRRATYSGPLPERFRLLVWDKREQRLVRLTFPFWMLRLQRDESVKINVDGFDLDNLGVNKEDLRLAGPALVVSYENSNSRVLVWTE